MKKTVAHTLAEVLITLIIVGVIAGFAVTIIKPFDKALLYLHSTAYEALRTAIYNASLTEISDTDNTKPFYKGAFPDSPKKLCEALTAYINTSQKDCSTWRGNPGSPEGVSDIDLPNFTANNGMRFYISSPYGLDYSNEDNGVITFYYKNSYGENREFEMPEQEGSITYYYVFVDLNGTKGPNTAFYNPDKPKKLPDIVAFAVFETFDVLPIGHAVFDTRYMYAKVDYGTPSNVDDPFSQYSDLKTYFVAHRNAWGDAVTLDDVRTFATILNNEDFNATSAFWVKFPLRTDEAYTREEPLPLTYPELDGTCSSEELVCDVVIQEYR